MKLIKMFILQGYERQLENGQLLDVITFELVADSYEEAEKKAKAIHKKPFYRLQAVIERSENNI